MDELIIRREEKHVVLTLNRPEFLNALNYSLIDKLKDTITSLNEDADVRCICITGNDKSFSTGIDIKERVNQIKKGSFKFYKEDPLTKSFRDLLKLIDNIEVPIIAVIKGYAVGGGLELALACDFRYAADNSKIGLTEAKVGSIPGGGGTQRLMRSIGKSLALELMFTGYLIDATQAERIGLVNKVYPINEILDKVDGIADTISKNAPLSLSFIKRAVKIGDDISLDDGLELEKILHGSIQKSKDYSEGMSAFRDKRNPNFKGD